MKKGKNIASTYETIPSESEDEDYEEEEEEENIQEDDGWSGEDSH